MKDTFFSLDYIVLGNEKALTSTMIGYKSKTDIAHIAVIVGYCML